jgi:hypothetical protein
MSTSFWKQFLLYFVAVFFPILAIVPGIRYMREADNAAKAVGVVVLLLTGISLLVNAYFGWVFWQSFKGYYQLLSSPISIENGVGESLDLLY